MSEERICCVCRNKIEGEGHASPEGVSLCSEVCFKRWADTIRGAYELTLGMLEVYGLEWEEKNRVKVLKVSSTFEWLVEYDKKQSLFYVH